MIGLVNGTSLFLFYEVFCLGKHFDCRSRNTAGVCIPEHTTAAGVKLLCLLLKDQDNGRASLDLNPAKLALEGSSPAARVQLSSYSDKSCS